MANREFYDPDAYLPEYEGFGDAALAVGVMIATAAVFLAILKKSGFKAMIAVGRGS